MKKDAVKKKAGLGKHAITLWGTSIFIAIASYLFYFSMARMLSPEEYGILYSLIAITYIFSVPTETIRFVISRYTAIFNLKKQNGSIKNLLNRSFKKITLLSIPIWIFLVLLSVLWLGKFLHISVWPLLIMSVVIPFLFLLPIIHGALQGLQKFVTLGINNSIEMVVKLILAVVLVFLGFKVYGAIIAIPLSIVVALIIGIIPLKKIMKEKETTIDTKHIYDYFFPFMLVIFFLTTMSSVDVLIARHFFSPSYAGLYAAISTIGTTLFFVSISVTKVMFPMVSEKHHLKEKEEHEDILYRSLLLVAIPSLALVLFLTFFPKLLVTIMFGLKYISISNFIKYEAIAMGFLALSNVISLYNLAINKKKFIFFPAIFCVLEIVLLSLFHGSLMQYLRMLILANVLLFIFLLISSVNIKNLMKKIKEYSIDSIIYVKKIKNIRKEKDSKNIKSQE